MSSSKLAHNIVHDIVDEITDRKGIGNEWFAMDDDIRDDLLKTLEDIVDNQLESVVAKTEALRQVIQAIENGQFSIDHRGRVYTQSFGSAFICKLRKGLND